MKLASAAEGRDRAAGRRSVNPQPKIARIQELKARCWISDADTERATLFNSEPGGDLSRRIDIEVSVPAEGCYRAARGVGLHSQTLIRLASDLEFVIRDEPTDTNVSIIFADFDSVNRVSDDGTAVHPIDARIHQECAETPTNTSIPTNGEITVRLWARTILNVIYA